MKIYYAFLSVGATRRVAPTYSTESIFQAIPIILLLDVQKWRAEVYSAFFEGLTLLVIMIGFFVAYSQLKHMKTDREIEIILEHTKEWSGKELEEARHTVNAYSDSKKLEEDINKFEKSNDYAYFILTRIPDLFEELGVLYARDKNLIDPIRQISGGSIIYYWNLYEEWIKDVQSRHSTAYTNFEKLKKSL